MSVRDLVVAMLTISDNAATDELVAIVGLDEINRIVSELGLGQTVITADLRQTLDAVARDVGLRDYQTLVAHQPSIDWRPSDSETIPRNRRPKRLYAITNSPGARHPKRQQQDLERASAPPLAHCARVAGPVGFTPNMLAGGEEQVPCALEPARRRAGNRDIGLREVATLEQQRLIADLRECVGEAVTEIQPSRMVAFAVADERVACDKCLR
jgi:hypothetical protein